MVHGTGNPGPERVAELVGGDEPPVPIGFDELRAAAMEAMDETAGAYVPGGAGSEDTVSRNRSAFDRWRIVPRMLRGVADRDLTVELFGRSQPPVALAPIGAQDAIHDGGELATARGAREAGVPMCLSTVSGAPMEEVAEELGSTPKWFQLYWSSEPSVTASLLDRAADAGFDAVVLTVDTPTLGWRERVLSAGATPFQDAHGMGTYFSDPAFRDLLDAPPEEDPDAAIERFSEVFGDPSLTWDDVEAVCAEVDLPVVVKGVLHPDDAREAVDRGAAGVSVSTHGGRQVDGSVAAVEALPAVVDAVGSDATVLLDSGIRRGSDVFRALALGADAVMVGRPYAYGLAAGGAAGVCSVCANLLASLDLIAGLCGRRSVSEIGRDAVVHERQLGPDGRWPASG
ncbi:alpha-hydroxy-acid oxidizing protein [Halobaculum sp. EA56]|uniref:alpha-hydroxy-acid oxidizing protein n=1 Tax=Halobaculum sp. EA56 TaxID=3421648 RepID=UPI003EB9CACD